MTAPQRKTIGPDPEALAQIFLTPKASPAFVVTKLEDADDISVNGAVRVESGGTVPVLEARNAAWDTSFLIHCYSPNEIEALDMSLKLTAEVAAARGLTVMGWYVADVLTVIGATKLPEPDVQDLVRYRSAVTWRVAAKPIT